MPSLIQANTGQTIGIGSNTVTHTVLNGVTQGDTLVFLVSYTNGNLNTPQDTANNATAQGWQTALSDVNNNAAIDCFYMLNANSGTHNVAWLAVSGAYADFGLFEFPPCTAVDVIGGAGIASGTVTTVSANNITTNTAVDLVLAIMGQNDPTGIANANFTTPAGFTQLMVQNNTSVNEGCEFAYKYTTIPGTQTATWNFTAGTASATYIAALVAFTGVATSGSGIIINTMF